MEFEILSEIDHVETIAKGRGVRDRHRLIKMYGRGRWRKLKGIAMVQPPHGGIREAEIHWYEAQGIGRKEFRIKRYLG